MKNIKKIFKAICHPSYALRVLFNMHWFCRLFPEKSFLKIKYRLNMGKKLNLKTPQTFNEKLQWLKLYNRKPEMTMMADKYAVREYIKNTIGEEYLIPLINVWDRVEEIDFDSLPEQFVLKCTHNSGLGMCICKDKSILDIKKVKKALKKGMREKYFYTGREWCYKNIKPRIIAEEYMEESNGELCDYKFLCFNGQVRSCFTCTDRFSGEGLKVTFFDNEWNRLPFERHYKQDKNKIDKPVNFEKMKELATKLSSELLFVRVDFYEVNGKIYFGELTFFPGSGMEEFSPEEWDYTLGSWIKLPQK